MNSDLFFDGNKYISCKRAAKISGYVTDYIGQLCRDGKLECKMVGRSWYVSLESLIAHKNCYISGTKSKPSQFFKNTSLLPALPSYELKLEDLVEPVAKSYIKVSPILEIENNLSVKPPVAFPQLVSQSHISFGHLFPKAAAFMLAFMISVFGFNTMVSMNPTVQNNYQNTANIISTVVSDVYLDAAQTLSASVFASVQNGVAEILSTISNMTNKFAEYTKNKIFAVLNKKVEQGDVKIAPSNIIATGPSQGLVVIPVNSDTNKTEAIEKVKKTFSDEVYVEANDDGSGVITPVFRENPGDEYLYVLVPIQN